MFVKALLFVGVLGSQILGASDFFPLQPGNRWIYREARTGQTLTMQVGVPTLTNGRLYYSLSGYVQSRLLVRTNEAGDLVYLNEDHSTEFVLTPFTPFEGGWWQAPFRQCDQQSQAVRNRGGYEGPAGTYSGGRYAEMGKSTATCRCSGPSRTCWRPRTTSWRRRRTPACRSPSCAPRFPESDRRITQFGRSVADQWPIGESVSRAAKPAWASYKLTGR